MLPPVNRTLHQSGLLENLDVLGDGRKRYREWSGQLCDPAFARSEPFQHRPPYGVTNRAVRGIEPILAIFNH